MKNLLILLVLAVTIVSSCKTKKEVTKASVENTSVTDNAAQCFDGQHDIMWSQLAANKIMGATDKVENPPVFFRVDNNLLRAAFEVSFKKQEQLIITLPFLINNRIECKTFRLRDSESIARQEQISKQIYSFVGEETENTQNRIRLDFHSQSGIKAVGTFNGETAMLKSIKYNGQIFHVAYNNSHADQLQKKFEIDN